MSKMLPSLCIILGIITLVSVSAYLDARSENNRWNAAYSSVLSEEQNLRGSLGEAQQREAAANDNVSELQNELTRCNKALDIAEARLQQSAPVNAGNTPDEQTNAPQTYTITDRSGRVYSISLEDYQRVHPIGQQLDKQAGPRSSFGSDQCDV